MKVVSVFVRFRALQLSVTFDVLTQRAPALQTAAENVCNVVAEFVSNEHNLGKQSFGWLAPKRIPTTLVLRGRT
jgi:hypothetical protein